MTAAHLGTRSVVRVATMVAILGLGLPVAQAADIDKGHYTLATAKIAKAEKALEKGNHEQAEKLYRQAIEIEPAVPTGHLGLGAALVAQQRFAEALEVLEEAEASFVEWEATLARADLQQRQAAFRDAQGAQDLIAAQRQGVRAPTNTGNSGLDTRDQALKAVGTQQFLATDRWKMEELGVIPPQVFYLEGIAHLRSNQPERGARALEICLALDPDHGLAHYNLAVALFGRGSAPEAKSHLDAAIEAGVEPHPAFVADVDRVLAQLEAASE